MKDFKSKNKAHSTASQDAKKWNDASGFSAGSSQGTGKDAGKDPKNGC